MFGGPKTLLMLAVALMPGGLLVMAAWILGRVVAHRMQSSSGDKGARLARAVASVRWRDVWSEAQHAVAAPTST